jgi:hypothetical protein
MGLKPLVSLAPRRKGGRYLGIHPYTDENIKHVSWCLKNGIGVCAVPDWETPNLWTVIVRINDTRSPDPKTYKAPEALKKMYEYYEYYYNKQNKE